MPGSRPLPSAIPYKERLIVALDVPSLALAQDLVLILANEVRFFKVGMEMFMTGDGFNLVHWLHKQGKKIFVDLKFFDVPQTVASAVRALSHHKVHFCTVHGNQAMMEAAVANKGSMKVLAVTALTSLDQGDLTDMGFSCEIGDLVLSRARRALAAGCDGLVSSGLEASAIRRELGSQLLVIVPGIRPVVNRHLDDQKRTADVTQAFALGADYIVVGRPIHQAPDPRQAAERIQKMIAKIFALPEHDADVS